MFAFFAPGVGGCNMIFDIKLSPVPRGFVNVLFRPLNKSPWVSRGSTRGEADDKCIRYSKLSFISLITYGLFKKCWEKSKKLAN